MPMAWDARLKAAWHGEASGTDLTAMFAATAGLSGLKQSLEDHRLEAKIQHTGHDWRAVLAVGRIAAPLWLADTLVGLAGALYDAETRSHPERPSSVSRITFEGVAALLAPVEDIIADVTAALVDSTHRTALSVPLHVGPGGDIASDPPRGPVSLAYTQGLAAGARQVHTAASAALVSVRTEVARSDSPNWLLAGLQRLDGELQGAGARLDMSETRLTALVGTRTVDPAALAAVCTDLWRIVDTATVAGQRIADPHLLPGAADSQYSASSAPSRVPPASSPLAPSRRAPPKIDAVPLPHIDPGAAPLLQRRDMLPPAARSAAAPPPPEVALPVIGEPSQQRAPDTAPQEKPHPPDAQEKPGTQADAKDKEPPIMFPEIG
jgi:hypothetical protein